MFVAIVLLTAVVNCALGFALAAYLGHGPQLSIHNMHDVRRLLRRALRLDRPAH